MSYKKFDDPVARVDQSARSVHDAFYSEPMRRAIQSVTNRVVFGGKGGTASTTLDTACGTGSTAGLKIGNLVTVTINGRWGTVFNRDNMELPAGTQGKSTVVKYLISSGFGTSGTITAGNEGTSGTTAMLPDLPDGHVALGYMEYTTGTAGAFIRQGGGTAGAGNVVSGNVAGTCGTVSAFVDLVHYPYNLAG